jgi:uncharacterized protein YuzE
MELKYFPDTDTLLINFTHKDIVETRDINENILVELDQDGHLVSMTVEHAKQHMDIENFSYQNVASISSGRS